MYFLTEAFHGYQLCAAALLGGSQLLNERDNMSSALLLHSTDNDTQTISNGAL